MIYLFLLNVNSWNMGHIYVFIYTNMRISIWMNKGRSRVGIKSLTIYSFTLFLLGLLGISINRSNLILLLMSVELMLLSTSILFVISSSFYGQVTGQLFTLFIFTVAAAESAIGLAIIVSYFRLRGKISIKLLNILKG